jgi:two-component system sensor histidine kinase/response regulator
MSTAEMLVNSEVVIDDEMKNTLLKELSKSSKTTYNLLENLLSWSRNQIGSIVFHPENFNLSDKVDDIFMFLKSQAKLKSIELVNNIDLNTEVDADINMVEVIMRNLISSAIKFTNELGRIEVGCSRLNGFLEIYIKDNGVGMDEETLKNIFDPLIFKTSPGTNNEPGKGLGLKLVKDFIIKNK